jgi:hypothetical protein
VRGHHSRLGSVATLDRRRSGRDVHVDPIAGHLLELQRSAGNAAVGQLVLQRKRFHEAVAIADLSPVQAAQEISYGELPGVTFTFNKSYVSASDEVRRDKSGKFKPRVNPGFGEEFAPSTGAWVLHTHRGSGGGLLKVHTKAGSFTTDHADVTIAKAVDKKYLKDPDASRKPR